MPLYIIVAIIFILYARTLTYKYVVDDYVRREGYLWEVPTKGTNPAFFLGKPSWNYRLFMIGMHAVNSSIIYLLWGWQASLIFAVHPMSVWATAWVTGNYYGTTLYFTLIAFYFLTQTTPIIGVPIAMVIYLCALNSTVDAMSFPFIFLFASTPWGLTLLAPLLYFYKGKRFQEGFKIRTDILKGKRIDRVDFPINRLFFMTKVMGRYIFTFFVPKKVYFFTAWAEQIREDENFYQMMHEPNEEFWSSLILCLSVFVAGLFFHPLGTVWFFITMALHSQFNIVGQPFAQRYLYLPMVGLCVVCGTALLDYPLVLLAISGWLASKSSSVIPQWKDQYTILKNEVMAEPLRASSHSAFGQYLMVRQKLNKQTRAEVNETSMYIRRSYELEPENWVIRMNFAAFLSMIGRLPEAIHETEETLRILEARATEREKPNVDLVKEQIVRLKNSLVEATKQQKKFMREEKRKADTERKNRKGRKR